MAVTSTRGQAPADLLPAARSGDRAALARLLSLVERGGEGARAVGVLTHGQGGDAYTVGLTGAPGAGKSTLTNALARRGAPGRRASGSRCWPSTRRRRSPGAPSSATGCGWATTPLDEGVFIRSMATRGHLGGLAVAAPEAVRVLTAAGFPWVILETVGVGQVEVDVAAHADTTVVVVNPGWGDAVQANKAGLLEIADVFVVNKADRPGADDAVADLQRMLDLAGTGHGPGGGGRPSCPRWRPTAPAWPTCGRPSSPTATTWGPARARPGRAPARPGRRRGHPAGGRPAAWSGPGTLTDGPQAAALAEAVAAGDTDPWTAADELLPRSSRRVAGRLGPT